QRKQEGEESRVSRASRLSEVRRPAPSAQTLNSDRHREQASNGRTGPHSRIRDISVIRGNPKVRALRAAVFTKTASPAYAPASASSLFPGYRLPQSGMIP